MNNKDTKYQVAIIGARGYVGHELIKLLSQHPDTEIIAVSSRSAAGKKVYQQVKECTDKKLAFSNLNSKDVAKLQADVVFLALPNNISPAYVNEIRAKSKETVIIDLSFDHRMESSLMGTEKNTENDTNTWSYGLSELNSKQIKNSKSIANPGCYATAAQLALYPLRNKLLNKPSVFGVSGYSGAGSTPSDNNDSDKLKDNLRPYKLSGHLHEQEISKHLGHPVNFMPHVASYFQGLSVTIAADLSVEMTKDDLVDLYTQVYQQHPLVTVQADIPYTQDIAKKPGAIIGGFSIDERDGKNVRLVCVEDNLLKGAAVQAVQNMNLALDLDSLNGIILES